jgi:hypothetical protein
LRVAADTCDALVVVPVVAVVVVPVVDVEVVLAGSV